MTRMGIKEYVEALRERYSRGSKKEKGKFRRLGCAHHYVCSPAEHSVNTSAP